MAVRKFKIDPPPFDDTTPHLTLSEIKPAAISMLIGDLLKEGRRKAVAELHPKGISTYGWKDGQVVETKPTKK